MKTHGDGGRRKRRYYHRKSRTTELNSLELPAETPVQISTEENKDVAIEQTASEGSTAVVGEEVKEKSEINDREEIQPVVSTPLTTAPDLDDGDMPDNENVSF